MVRQASKRVPQLPHAERVAKKRVSASHYRPELRQGEGELEHVPYLVVFSVFCSILYLHNVTVNLTVIQKQDYSTCQLFCSTLQGYIHA